MLLAIDIGNSNLAFGIFRDRVLQHHWRLRTDLTKTSDQYGAAILDLIGAAGMEVEHVLGVIVSSVVPALTPTIEELARIYLHRHPLVVSADMDTGLKILYTNPRELGIDRLVNAAVAYARYRRALIIVDCGTATTFSAVSGAGEYLGGAIAPGLGIATEALVLRTAQLPAVNLVPPKTAIGRDTVSSIQAGLVFGHAGLVDEIVRRMQTEMGQETLVLATGGLAGVIAPESRMIQETRPFLILEGLEWLYRRVHGDA